MNNKKYGLKKTYIIILLIFSLFSCNKSEKKKAVLKEPVVIAFGLNSIILMLLTIPFTMEIPLEAS
jgi:hypothetical protein